MAERPRKNVQSVWKWLPDLMTWLGRYELTMLISLVLVAGGIWGFAELADEVMEGKTHALDEALLLAMRNPDNLSDLLGPKWLEETGRDFTALGGVGVLMLLTLAVAGFLVLDRKFHAALFLAVSVFGGSALSAVLKQGFDRPRPDLVPHVSYVYTASFPSGHSMMAAVTYLTLGALLARMHSRRRVKAYFILLAMGLSFLVGVSRVYMGVHWPTDVLAGWTAGAVWALLCWLVARWLQRRGHVERDTQQMEEINGIS